jgi:hypothetical protein
VGVFFVSCCLQIGQGFVITYVINRNPPQAEMRLTIMLLHVSFQGHSVVAEVSR